MSSTEIEFTPGKLSNEAIVAIVKSAGISDEIIKISKPNAWIMESRRIYFADGKVLLLKIGTNDEWTDEASILNQLHATQVLHHIGIPQPNLLAYAENKTSYGFRFLLLEAYNGTRLYDLYSTADSVNRIMIFESLAYTYSKIHRIKNSWSGVWNGSPDKKKYPIHPARFYSNAEFHGGSGRFLLEKGIISKALFDDICNAWDNNLPYLEQRESSLAHISPFPWSIYMAHDNGNYSVTGLAALGDFMWWDPMSDVAHLLYPPYMDKILKHLNLWVPGNHDPPLLSNAVVPDLPAANDARSSDNHETLPQMPFEDEYSQLSPYEDHTF